VSSRTVRMPQRFHDLQCTESAYRKISKPLGKADTIYMISPAQTQQPQVSEILELGGVHSHTGYYGPCPHGPALDKGIDFGTNANVRDLIL